MTARTRPSTATGAAGSGPGTAKKGASSATASDTAQGCGVAWTLTLTLLRLTAPGTATPVQLPPIWFSDSRSIISRLAAQAGKRALAAPPAKASVSRAGSGSQLPALYMRTRAPLAGLLDDAAAAPIVRPVIARSWPQLTDSQCAAVALRVSGFPSLPIVNASLSIAGAGDSSAAASPVAPSSIRALRSRRASGSSIEIANPPAATCTASGGASAAPAASTSRTASLTARLPDRRALPARRFRHHCPAVPRAPGSHR